MTGIAWDENRLAEFRTIVTKAPIQSYVGRSCGSYLAVVRELFPNLQGTRVDVLYPEILRGTDRELVGKICRDSDVHVLEAYAVAMAWGGQWEDWFLSSVRSLALQNELKRLRSKSRSRQDDFATIKEASKEIKGLGISFFTKVLFFFRPIGDAYILDQFTAKSMALLRPGTVRLHGHLPPADTSPEEYEGFCKSCDELAEVLGFGNGEAIERALFDHRKGAWRALIRAAYPKRGAKRTQFDRSAFLEEVAGAHGEAEAHGPSVPQGILRCRGSCLWIGGKGAGSMKWYYKVRSQMQCVEIGVLSARQGLEVLSELRAADNAGLLSEDNDRENFPSIIEFVPFGELPESELADEAVQGLSSLYQKLKILAKRCGIRHEKLS